MTELLSIDGLSVEGRNPSGEWATTVHNASLSLREGEVVALIGESGAGKTTLALAALGYVRPGTRFVAGQIYYRGESLLGMSREERRRVRGRNVSYVAQSASAALNPAHRIGSQIAETLAVHDVARGLTARQRVIELLGLLQLPSPAEIAGRYPLQLSGGQQQRAMIAMAMSCAPSLLVLDEPTTALDVTTQIDVLKAIKDVIASQRTAAIYVSHDLSVVSQLADRILVMRAGRIVEEGSTRQVIERPVNDYTRALISAVRRDKSKSAGTPPAPRTTPPAVRPVVRPILSVAMLRASYEKPRFGREPSRAKQILHDVSFDLGTRETLAVIGESGSGKTTLARVIAGLHPALSGEMRLDGVVLPSGVMGRSPQHLRRIQLIFQSPELALNPNETIGRAIDRTLTRFFCLSAADRRARTMELLRKVGLASDSYSRMPRELSGGQRQRASIARALSAEPDIIICDEILSALDSIVAARVLDLLEELRESTQASFIFISHDLATVSRIADRVAVMYGGKIVEMGSCARIFAPPHHPYTDLLLKSVPELRVGWLDDVLAQGVISDRQITTAAVVRDDGCPFRLRCPISIDRCGRGPPPLLLFGGDHSIACHRAAELEVQ